ncbi:unnamed protein product [Anisakis simplex]|uniref:G_PROTEIN_RECEP_F2_4 domain-containing protein n=1 Tax=Anisakis simplex TaxID=6269 RepID=A0A158PN53_ANISI|nr:unnamed protein product [Anisakis simplex]
MDYIGLLRYCRRTCRLQFVDKSSGLCKQPHPDDQCFGVPIRYNYTIDAPDVIDSLHRYQILSRFPRCWSALGPLLCAVAYRPCSNRRYFELTMTEPGTMEMWQVFRKDMCYRALHNCGFVSKSGLWPSFINCSHTPVNKMGRQLFSNGSCEVQPATMDRSQCLWPLIESDEVYRSASPIIDDCYMSCRTPLLRTEGIRRNLLTFIFTISLFITLLTFICFIYISIFSSMWLNNLCVYTIGHALLSAAIYWSVWLTGFFDAVADSVMCIGNGRIRRHTYGISKYVLPQTGALQWCNIESWFLHTFLLSAFLWLSSFVILRLGHVPIRKDHRIYLDGRPEISIRCVLLVVYLIAAIIATVALWMNTAESDGLVGVCFIGLRSVSNATVFIYVPILLFLISALILSAFFFFRRRCEYFYLALLELEDDERNAQQEFDKNVEESDEASNVSISKSVRLESNAMTESHAFIDDSNDENFPDKDITETNQAKERNVAVEPELKASNVMNADGSHPTRRIYRRKKDGCGYTAISQRWFAIILISILVALFASWIAHSSIDIEHDSESRLILESIRCSLNKTILGGHTDWLNATRHSDHLIGQTDPLLRRKSIGSSFAFVVSLNQSNFSSLNAPECELSTLLDDRISAILLTFIVFPSVPFITLVVFVISGFCGYGLKDIEKIRPVLNPFVVEKIGSFNISDSTEYERNMSSMNDQLELLPMWSSAEQDRVSKWTGKIVSSQRAPARICSSANCLSDDLNEEKTSINSQTVSEPADPNVERPSRIRRLNLLERYAERKRNRGHLLSSSAISEVQARLSANNLSSLNVSAAASDSVLRHSDNAPTFNTSTDIRSIYSSWLPTNPSSSANLTGISEQVDPAFQTAAVVSAYQTGIIEGRYQERCNRYADQIRQLTENLDQANRELRRISAFPESLTNAPEHTVPSHNSTNEENTAPPRKVSSEQTVDSESDSSPTDADQTINNRNDLDKAELLNAASLRTTPNKSSGIASSSAQDGAQNESNAVASEQTNQHASVVSGRKRSAPVDGSSKRHSKKKSNTKAEDKVDQDENVDWMVVESEDSNNFNSDDEDSEEERFFNEMCVVSASEGHREESQPASNSADGSSTSASGNRVLGNVRVGGCQGALPVRSSSISASRSPMTPLQLNARPFNANNNSNPNTNGVVLTAEQRLQLQRLRNQLTESDLMNWSEYFRRLAFEHARSRDMARMLNIQQQVQARVRGSVQRCYFKVVGLVSVVPAVIREEEEELVMDPFSNEPSTSNSNSDESRRNNSTENSRVDSSNSSTNQNDSNDDQNR